MIKFDIFTVMPTPKGSKALAKKNSFIGNFAKNKKQISDLEKTLQSQQNAIKEIQNKKEQVDSTLTIEKRKLDAAEHRLQYKRRKIEEISQTEMNVITQLPKESISFSKRFKTTRIKNTSSLEMKARRGAVLKHFKHARQFMEAVQKI